MKQIFLKALSDRNPEVIQWISKIIAYSVRESIEDFHVNHLTDTQMKELNPLIRNGIHTALWAFMLSDTSQFAFEVIQWFSKAIPDYWEEPKLIPELEKIVAEMETLTSVSFESEFLNEEYRVGNIVFNQVTRCIEIVPSYDFKGTITNNHKHRDKISRQLRKEGYYFVASLNGYVKRK